MPDAILSPLLGDCPSTGLFVADESISGSISVTGLVRRNEDVHAESAQGLYYFSQGEASLSA